MNLVRCRYHYLLVYVDSRAKRQFLAVLGFLSVTDELIEMVMHIWWKILGWRWVRLSAFDGTCTLLVG